MIRSKIVTALLSFQILLAGCATTAPADNPPAAMEKPMAEATEPAMAESPTAMADAEADAPMAAESTPTVVDAANATAEPAAMVEEPQQEATTAAAWLSLPLTDARTGAPFTLGDFAGKIVFVEPMATWCSNCRQQLTNVAQVRGQLAEDVIFVALSVETETAAGDLAAYSADNGFDWIFAVMTPELLTDLVNSFGPSVANPPATPHFVIAADGAYTDLMTGIASPQEIADLVDGG